MSRDTWKAIQSKVFSYLFHIKWDVTLVSRASVGWVIPVSQVLRYWGSLGKLGPNTPNHAQGHTKRNPKTPAPHLTSNEVLLLCQSHLMVQLYLFYGYLSIRAMWENRAQIPHQIIWSDAWKVMQQLEPDTPSHGYVIQSVKLHISHQMKSYSNVKAIWESIYTCFCVPVELGQVRETRPKLPKSWASIHRVIQSVKFHISHQVKPYSNVKVICRSGCTCFNIFGELWQVRKIGPKFPIS